MLNWLRTRLADERGSVAMAMTAIVVGALCLMGMARAVEGGLSTARVDQNRINAFQHADAGVDLAVYRLDRNDFAGVDSGGATGFTDSVVLDGSRFDVSATPSPTGEGVWTVRSTGTDPGGRKRLVVATVSTPRMFRNGFFTVKDFNLTGSQSYPVAYDSKVCPMANCADIIPVPARLGTNAEVTGASATIADMKARWDGFDMYGRATQADADAACDDGGCGTAPEVAAITNQLDHSVPPAPGSAKPCPSGGIVNGGSIASGDYHCTSLELSGTVTVPGGYDDRVRIWVDGPFTLASDAVVNQRAATPKFQIFQTGIEDGDEANGDICNGEIWGLLYAPNLVIDCRGSHQPVIYGAVVAQFHDGRGSHFDFHYDVRAAEIERDERFTVTNWRECPVGATDC